MTWFALLWNILLPLLMVVDARRDDRWAREHFDLRHCAWAGPSAPATRICLPLDGCWIADQHGAVICYRRAELIGGQP